MSTRLRLALLLTAVVVATLSIAFLLLRGAVFGPFAQEMLKAHIDQVVFVAEELERGVDPASLEEKLGLEIRVMDRLGMSMNNRERRGRGGCFDEERRGHQLVICRGPRAPVAVRWGDKWIVVRRDLDAGGLDNRVGPWLLMVALIVIGAAFWLSGLVTKPLRASLDAMGKMADGDLSHRLPDQRGAELREVARAFNAMADRVDAILRAEKELMAGISHELRTPLARLRLELELLREQAQAPEKRVGAMELDLLEIDRLIGELLEISRLTLGERRLELEPLDLAALVHELLAQRPLAAHKVTVLGSASPVQADRARLTRLISNLLQNAEKYAPAGSEVEIALEGTSLEVRDRGPGVPPEELPRIFEPFFRGARTRTSSATGLGLGLMIARQVALLHGGTISAANRADGGLTIRLSLPG